MHVAGIDSADMADLLDLPRTTLFALNTAAIAQLGHDDMMTLTMTVMKEEPMTNPALTYNDTLDNQEARAHSTLVRLASEYPSRFVTYDVVLAQLNLVRDLNRMMDRDEQMDEVADKYDVPPDFVRLIVKREEKMDEVMSIDAR